MTLRDAIGRIEMPQITEIQKMIDELPPMCSMSDKTGRYHRCKVVSIGDTGHVVISKDNTTIQGQVILASECIMCNYARYNAAMDWLYKHLYPTDLVRTVTHLKDAVPMHEVEAQAIVDLFVQEALIRMKNEGRK